MAQCRVCARTVANYDPFCRFCGHSRVGEFLLAPAREPRWLDPAVFRGLVIVGLAFAFTIGIAFLREAQALRWGRTELAVDNDQRAYQLLSPFVSRHPDHREALFLLGQASIRTGHVDEALTHYQTLHALADDLETTAKVARLRQIYHEALVREAASLQCGRTPFAEYFKRYSKWRRRFNQALFHGAAALATRCAAHSDSTIANEPGHYLIHEQEIDAQIVVEKLYLSPARRQLEAGDFRSARHLAAQAMSLSPRVDQTVDLIFKETRTRFEASYAAMRILCEGLASDEEYRQCFPPKPPEDIRTFRDAWDNPVAYLPAYKQAGCFRRFRLASWAPEEPPPSTQTSEGPEPTIVLELRAPRKCRVRTLDRFWLDNVSG